MTKLASSALALLFGAATALSLVACDATDSNLGGAGGTSSQNPGGACKEGDSKLSDDGCNTCGCSNGDWVCTTKGCAAGGSAQGGSSSGGKAGNGQAGNGQAGGAQAGSGTGGSGTAGGGQGACKPGDTMPSPDGCNTCSCTADGQWACTEKACADVCKTDADCPQPGAPCQMCADGSTACPSVKCVSGQCVGDFPTCPAACKPGETMPSPDGCNTCSCDESGQWQCTLIECGNCTGPMPDCAAPPPGCTLEGAGCVNGNWTCGTLVCNNQCKPGETMPAPDGCNTCTCTPDGQWACTKVACPEPCKPGDTRPAPDGCNTCVCDDAGNWACTEKGCAVTCTTAKECPAPGAPCQQCSDGTWACPSFDCVGGQCVYDFPTCAAVCKPGETQLSPDGCNTCTCLEGNQWVCTEKACAACTADSDCPQIGAPCELCADGSAVCPSVACVGGQCVGSFPTCPVACNEGEIMPAGDGCNTCTCDANGNWNCTKMACPTECSPQDAHGEGLCDAFFGFAWDGTNCVGLSGCGCVGADCKATYPDYDTCLKAHASCPALGVCQSDADCPQIKAPCQVCADGSTVCPSVSCIAGQCVGSFPSCPTVCKPGETQPAPDGCNTCTCADDGTWGCTKIGCSCPFGFPGTGAACAADQVGQACVYPEGACECSKNADGALAFVCK